MRNLFLGLVTIIIAASILSCKKTDDFTSAPLTNYYPLAVGKYISYNLDSILFINFGTKDTIVKSQVRYTVDAKITDNLGRDAYRIIRYRRKTAANPWVAENTFMAVPNGLTSVEFTENNLRFIKLQLPIKEGFTWKGNSFIDTYSQNSNYKFMDGWDYTYTDIDTKFTAPGLSVDSTITVVQCDSTDAVRNVNTPAYGERNLSYEVYAKGVGMAYKYFLHWEYQPTLPNKPYVGYGVKLTMFEHN